MTDDGILPYPERVCDFAVCMIFPSWRARACKKVRPTRLNVHVKQ